MAKTTPPAFSLRLFAWRNRYYDMPDPWEEPVGIFLKQRERTPYVTFQDIYGALDIPAVRQTSENAKRIQ